MKTGSDNDPILIKLKVAELRSLLEWQTIGTESLLLLLIQNTMFIHCNMALNQLLLYVRIRIHCILRIQRVGGIEAGQDFRPKW